MKKKRILICFLIIVYMLISVTGVLADKIDLNLVIPVIMYHKIGNDTGNEYCVSESQIENDFINLKKNGFKAIGVSDYINMKEIYEDYKAKKTLSESEISPYKNFFSGSEKPVLLTFDDGYADGYDILFPLLKKYGFKANIAVVGNYSEKSSNFLSASQMKEMSDSGYVEFGNHSYKIHSFSFNELENIYADEKNRSFIYEDFVKNEEFIKNATGKGSFYFAYPYGLHSNLTEEILDIMGSKVSFLTAYSSDFINLDDPTERISRINRVPDFTGEELVSLLNKKIAEKINISRNSADREITINIKNNIYSSQITGWVSGGEIMVSESELKKIYGTEILREEGQVKINLFGNLIRIDINNKKIISKTNIGKINYNGGEYYPAKELFENIGYVLEVDKQFSVADIRVNYRY